MQNSDLELARQLQEEFDQEAAHNFVSSSPSQPSIVSKSSLSIIDGSWELTDPNPDIRALFIQYNDHFFWGRLSGIEVRWSPRMTLCAGLCVYERRGGLCSVRLSLPLLKLRPRKDLVETLLHEMIHAYLFVTDNNKDHDGHGPEFKKHMNRINKETGTSITVYHSFHGEVAEYRQHWWKCDGPCKDRPPYFGYVKRAMNRVPSARDPWWGDHRRTCGGTYTKVKEPEGYGNKKEKPTKDHSMKEMDKTAKPDIRSFLGSGQVGLKFTSGKPLPTSTATVSSQPLSNNDHHDPQHSNSSNPALVNERSIFFKNRTDQPISDDRDSCKHLQGNQYTESRPSKEVADPELPKVNWRPVLGNSRIPPSTGGTMVQTIWNNGGKNSSDNSNGERIKTSSSTFQSKGQVLGTRGQGQSFLAQLRREMNKSKSSSCSSKSVGNNLKAPDSVNTNSSTVKNNAIVDHHKHKVNSPGKIKRDNSQISPSSNKSIKEWFRSEDKNKVPQTHLPGKSTPSPNTDPSNGFGPTYRSGSDSMIWDYDDNDTTFPRQPLFKKVNPASNFTSPPQKRISLYNNNSNNRSMPASASASKGDNSQGTNSSDCGSKRKHVILNNSDSDDNDPVKFLSWTRRPRYSTSDDSDIEELLPPTKRFKDGGKVKGKNVELKHPEDVFQKVKKKHNIKKHGEKRSTGKTFMNIGNKREDNKVDRDVNSLDLETRGDNSNDPLQACPVCQAMVPISQINIHLDQCLSFD